MNRLIGLQSLMLEEIEKHVKLVPQRDEPAEWERVHIASCAAIGHILAEKRGVDAELAACACAAHDYGRIVTGKQADHAQAGYEPVKELLKRDGRFTDEEIEIIAIAVKNHSKKSEIGSPIEEIVKDADVLDMYQHGYELPREEQKKRLETMLSE